MSSALYETLTQLPDLPDAACRDHDPDMWDDTPPDMSRRARESQIRHAKQICDTCPVSMQCLEYAMRAEIRSGIWGGLTTDERIVLRRGSPPNPEARHCPRGRHVMQSGDTRCLKCEIAASKKRDRDQRSRDRAKNAQPDPRKKRCPQCRISKHRCMHPADGVA
jgi:WhiB family redox-sensing transcriptional regulator